MSESGAKTLPVELNADLYETKALKSKGDLIVPIVARFMDNHDRWVGTATEFLEELPELEMDPPVLARRLNSLQDFLYDVCGILYFQNQRTSTRKTFRLIVADREKQRYIADNYEKEMIRDGYGPFAKRYKTYEDLPSTLDADELANYLGISKSSAYELMHSKGFPTLQIGKRMVVQKEKLKIWCDEHTA